MKNTEKYVASLNDKYFSGDHFNTREEAINYMKDDLKSEPGTVFYVAKVREITVEMLERNMPCFLEDLETNFMENEDIGMEDVWLPQEDEELNKIIAEYLFKKYPPYFYGVEDIEEYSS